MTDFTPSFLSTEAQIKEINEWLEHVPASLRELEEDTQTKSAVIHEKIKRLQYELEQLRIKTYQKKEEVYRVRSEKQRQLQALKEAREKEAIQEQYQKTADLIKDIVSDLAAWFKARDYQAEDIISVVHQYVIGEPGVMNANEMALGKTFETVVALYILKILFERQHGRKPKILWLTKSSIVKTGGSVAEINRWTPDFKVASLDGSDPTEKREFAVEIVSMTDAILLTNYETCRTTKALQKVTWDFIIMDEVHKLKGGANVNGPTAVWEAVKDVATKASFIMMLTGTPLVNRAEEMWSYMHIFAPDEFPDAKDFTRRFTGFREAAGTFKLSIDAEKLFRVALKGRLIRRTAQEVGLQLPQVIRQDVILDHNPRQAEIYEQMRKRFFVWLEESDKYLTAQSVLAQLTRLRQINVLPVAKFYDKDENGRILNTIVLDERDSSKLDEAVRRILEHDCQAVGFCNFTEPMNELAMRLQINGKSVAIIDSHHGKDMSTYEREFQQGRIDILLINIQMGEGLNLHRDPDKWPGGAGYGFTLDRWWNNAKNDQCFKRVVRPGAPGPIFFDDYYVEHSVDDFIRALCDEKDEQFASVTENKAARPSADWRVYLEKLL